jgi:hypothetical protein
VDKQTGSETAQDLGKILLVAAWIALGYFTLGYEWWGAIKVPLSQITLSDIGGLIWAVGWRIGAGWGLLTLTLKTASNE